MGRTNASSALIDIKMMATKQQTQDDSKKSLRKIFFLLKVIYIKWIDLKYRILNYCRFLERSNLFKNGKKKKKKKSILSNNVNLILDQLYHYYIQC